MCCYSWSHIILYAHLSIYIFLQYSAIDTNSTVADKSRTKLQLHVHDTRYIHLLDTMILQSKRKPLENGSRRRDLLTGFILHIGTYIKFKPLELNRPRP